MAEVIVIGGGPAGTMAGMLLARAGVRALVLAPKAQAKKNPLRD